MALPDRIARNSLRGVTAPRLAPPEPSHTRLADFEAAAASLGIELMPWQRIAARYITALMPRRPGRPRKGEETHGDRWRYPEIAVVVARQNGKTELLLPRILMGLERGESILHTAQNRRLPRKTFLRVAGAIAAHPDIDYDIRKANGQEEITTPAGGRYVLVAPNESSRGESADLVLIDEVREQHDEELMDAMLPTVTARRNAQIVYLSNAGDQESLVLNNLRKRGLDGDPGLAYLEWSASPDRDLDDRDGWAEANPALGQTISLATLEHFRRTRPPANFETEHLCRWVQTMRPRLVDSETWENARDDCGQPLRPALGISMDPSGSRSSAALAWQKADGSVALQVIANVTGDPIDVGRFGPDLRALAQKARVMRVGFDPWTDQSLARHFEQGFGEVKPVNGVAFANASENFVRRLYDGSLHWQDSEVIGEDLTWATRKTSGNSWMAVKAAEDHAITALLAAIRAVWLASGPRPPAPRIL